MFFQVGGVELICILLAVASVAALCILRPSAVRSAMFVLMCVTTAAVLTPADILSMLVLAAAFGLIFFAGWMYSVGRTSPTASDQ